MTAGASSSRTSATTEATASASYGLRSLRASTWSCATSPSPNVPSARRTLLKVIRHCVLPAGAASEVTVTVPTTSRASRRALMSAAVASQSMMPVVSAPMEIVYVPLTPLWRTVWTSATEALPGVTVAITTRAPGSSPSIVLCWMVTKRVPSAWASGRAVTRTVCGMNQLRRVKVSVVAGLSRSLSGSVFTDRPRMKAWISASVMAAGAMVTRTVSSGSWVRTTV